MAGQRQSEGIERHDSPSTTVISPLPVDGPFLMASERTRPGPVGLCFDIQRFSIHNGPGIRSAVFLKGCPLTCPWCHNPEGRSPRPEVRVIAARCIECGACEAACPEGVARRGVPPDPNSCVRCGHCAEACPTGARQLIGRPMTVDELVSVVVRDRPFYEDSGGGVTFSGGEPFAQPAFLLACLEVLRSGGIHTTVDTCGFAGRAVLRRAADLTDLFLFDLKVMDARRHLEVTGVPLEPILGNLRRLDRWGARIWVRVPFVPGYNDDRANLEAMGAFVAGLRSTRRVHLLPYHRLGTDKRAGLGLDDPVADVPEPVERLGTAEQILSGFGLDVRIGG
jgi:pyruvate formate lyase activating enzyme